MPIRLFWFYNRQVDRLAAEQDLRTIHLLGAVTSGEGYKQALEGLEAQVGQISVFIPAATAMTVETAEGLDPEFDVEGFQAFKAKYGRKRQPKSPVIEAEETDDKVEVKTDGDDPR